MAATDAIADSTNGQEGITFKLGNAAGDQVNLVFALTGGGGDLRTRHAVSVSLAGTAGQSTVGLTADPGEALTVRVEGDLDLETFNTSYDNGSGFTAIISDGTGLFDLAEIILVIEGDQGGWATNNFMALGYVTLDAVPEPSSFALIAGIFETACLAVKRRVRES